MGGGKGACARETLEISDGASVRAGGGGGGGPRRAASAGSPDVELPLALDCPPPKKPAKPDSKFSRALALGGGGGWPLGAAQSAFGCPCNFGSRAGSATRHGFTTRAHYRLTSWGQRWAGPVLSNTYETKPTRGGVFGPRLAEARRLPHAWASSHRCGSGLGLGPDPWPQGVNFYALWQ